MPGGRHSPSRRYLLASLLSAALPVAGGAASLPALARQNLEDFDTFWRAIDTGYAYLEGRRAAWRQSRAAWGARAARARNRDQLVAMLETAIASLHDDAVFLDHVSAQSPRRIPEEVDLWPAWRGSDALLESVRATSEADASGLHPGMIVTRIDGAPIETAVREVLGRSPPNAAARDWALRHALAGPRRGTQRLEVRTSERARMIEVERQPASHSNGAAVMARRIGEARDLGYIRIRRGLAEPELVTHWDAAFNALGATRGVILDLRDVNRPGGREATLAILGRFVSSERAWQVREVRGAKVVDKVSPGPGTSRAPLLVLVDRWTAGEGEALAAGLHAAAGAKLVGTRMAGLRGEPAEVRLPHSDIPLRFPAQRTFLVDGTPRENLRPQIEIDPSAPAGGPGDPILYQALKLLA